MNNKRYFIAAVFILALISLLALPTACTLLKKSSSGTGGSTAYVSEPLISTWKMSRISIEPPLPSAIPGFVADLIIPKNPTWSIAVSGSQVTPSYDGRATWFNPLGVSVDVRTPSITQSADKRSATLNGGGTIQAKRLPGLLALLPVSNLTINYSDKIEVMLNAENQVSATITYSASGKYTGSKGPDSFNNASTVKYTGTRK